jgi:hypothetical protein
VRRLVQGAEMSILTSLDWERFSFDVLCIENQYSEAANDAIKLLLAQRHDLCIAARRTCQLPCLAPPALPCSR